jgi:pimeloyl-ACP methyl ester carboxylesterase
MRRPQLHRRYLPAAADAAGGPDKLDAIVLCPGLIQNRYSFEAPTRSLPAYLMERRQCVYVVEPHGRHADAGGPRDDSFIDVVEHDVAPQLEDLLRRHPKVAWLGHSLGGLIGLALPPAVSQRLSAMITVGTPLLPAVGVLGRRPVNKLAVAVSRQLHRRELPLSGRFFGGAFRAFKPLMNTRGMRYPLQIYAPGSMHPLDLDFFLKHSWAQDSFGLVGDLLELLVNDGTTAGGLPVGEHLRELQTPLLVLGGDLDGLAPPPAVEALYERAGSAEKRLRIFNRKDDDCAFGHMDLLIGKAAPRVVWPAIAAFLDAHH